MAETLTFFNLDPLRQLKWRAEAAWMGRSRRQSPELDIIVTTYIARFDTYFKGILFQLSRLFRGHRLVVVVNGHYDRERQDAYLDRLQQFVSRFPNVQLVICDEPVGLSAMWNRAIAQTRSERILILNDDLYLMSRFRDALEKSSVREHSVTLINGSWSHFVITRPVLEQVGPFDENFRAIGYEDRDYELRLIFAGIGLDNVSVAGIVNCVAQPSEYSYGEDMAVSDGKYSCINRDYFYRKWAFSEHVVPGAVYVPGFAKWVKRKDMSREACPAAAPGCNVNAEGSL